MKRSTESLEKYWRIGLALTGWFSLVLQFILLLNGPESGAAPVSALVIKFFSYFTILTNLLVAFSLSVSFAGPTTGLSRFFAGVSTRSAITVYILAVGIIYNLVLRSLWNPRGAQLAADVLLHQVTPAAYTLYWLFFVKKGQLKWNQPLNWLIYPVVYLIYVLIRGEITGQYPYPFVDISQIGYQQAFLNILAVAGAFVLLSALLLVTDRILWQLQLSRKN